jgi:hypothetical protein
MSRGFTLCLINTIFITLAIICRHICHSRAGGNPVLLEVSWIPDQVRNDVLCYILLPK